MDLGAYVQIESLSEIAKKNGIHVPRLRGYRLMSGEEPVSNEIIAEQAFENAMDVIDMIVRSGSVCCWVGDRRADRRANRCLVTKNRRPVGVKWDKVHGRLRKRIKFEIKKAFKNTHKQFEAWNRYCGKNVLYIHARIGGANWLSYDGDTIEKQPWFIEKVDDAFDSTYCDIYAKLN